MDTDQRPHQSTNRPGRGDGHNRRSRRPERLSARALLERPARPTPVLLAATIAVVSLSVLCLPSTPGASASADGPGPERHSPVVQASVTTASTAGLGSWGHTTEPTLAYEREIGSGPTQEPIANLYPDSPVYSIYAYCKTPLPGTSRYQYRAAIPSDPNASPQLSYRMAWVPGGTFRFARLMDIPHC